MTICHQCGKQFFGDAQRREVVTGKSRSRGRTVTYKGVRSF